MARLTARGTWKRFRGGLKAHRLCVALNTRLDSNKEEGQGVGIPRAAGTVLGVVAPHCRVGVVGTLRRRSGRTERPSLARV